MSVAVLPVALVGDGLPVPCADGVERPYLPFDAAGTTGALPAVLDAVEGFLPWYSSAGHGAGYKAQASVLAYQSARLAALAFAGRGPDCGDVAVFCQNTTEAIGRLAAGLGLGGGDVVVTTAAEHDANVLPWSRLAACRHVGCGPEGTFEPADVAAVLGRRPVPRLLAVTGASHVTGWLPPLGEIIAVAHHRGVPVLVDAAQLAPHRPLPAGAEFLAWSGHKMYAPFGAGVLVGPRRVLAPGGGRAGVPGPGEPGAPNVIGAVALAAATGALEGIGWPAITGHDLRIAGLLRRGLAAVPGVRLHGPAAGTAVLPIVTFTVQGLPGALVAARLAAEDAIEVRHGGLSARACLARLLGPGMVPGAVRASAGINTSGQDVARLLGALARLVSAGPPVRYRRDRSTGDFYPARAAPEPASR